jgi:hypothetical protein
MNDLDLVKYGDWKLSIKDLTNDIDISQTKWNFIFKSLTDSEIYFWGHRHNYIDDEFEQNINFLSDEILISEDKSHTLLLFFRLKHIDINYNRNLIAKVWSYFENPALMFLKSITEQDILVRSLKQKLLFEDLLDTVDDIAIIHLGMEFNVLWILGNQELGEVIYYNYLK